MSINNESHFTGTTRVKGMNTWRARSSDGYRWCGPDMYCLFSELTVTAQWWKTAPFAVENTLHRCVVRDQGCLNKLKQELENNLYIVGISCLVIVLIQVDYLLLSLSPWCSLWNIRHVFACWLLVCSLHVKLASVAGSRTNQCLGTDWTYDSRSCSFIFCVVTFDIRWYMYFPLWQ